MTLQPLSDDDPMPFGAHKDKPMRDVPADYLDWLHGQPWLDKWIRVKKYIENNRDAIDKELKDQGKI